MVVCKTDIESEPMNELGLLSEFTHLRWDHARTDLYYEHSRVLLQPVLDDLDNIIEHLNERHSSLSHIDHVYKRVVDCLVNCAKMFIPKKQQNFYKFWWSQELDVKTSLQGRRPS